MFRLSVNITIGSLSFGYVSECEIKHSWRDMTSTCSIRLPRNLKLQSEELRSLIKRGNKVEVKAGYDGELRTEFNGYVIRVKNTTPLMIECEDEMFNLKSGSITKSWPSTSLQQVVSYVYPGESKVFDANIGPFTLNKTTPALALEEIKRNYNLSSFFRNGVLVVGLPYDKATATNHKFNFQKNIAENESLEFRSKDDFKLKVKAISILPSNQKIEIEIGDKDGQERTMHYYNLQKPALEAIANAEIEKLKYDGYSGSFTSFGVPPVEMGDIVHLNDPRYPDNAGSYWVDEVNKSIGMGGIRRRITLGPRT